MSDLQISKTVLAQELFLCLQSSWLTVYFAFPRCLICMSFHAMKEIAFLGWSLGLR